MASRIPSSTLFFFPLILWQLAICAQAQPPTGWTTFPFNPPSLPLAVKNPYLNAWAPLAGTSAAVSQAWPRSYLPLTNELEWFASIRVDGMAYKLLGEVNLPNVTQASQKSFTFTPTQTLYTLSCGNVSVNMNFVSPIEATDLVRLSTPFSYLQVTASSSDGKPHSVQVYSDISGSWIAGDLSLVSEWAVDDSDSFHFVSLRRRLREPVPFTESINRPQDAIVYYAANKTDMLSWQIGPSQDTRLSFANGTKFSNSIQTGQDPIGPPSANNTILGLAIDLGTIQSQNNSAVFALGIVRDPIIQYTNGQGKTENRTGYYWSKLPDLNNVIADVLDHFPDALAAADALDLSLSQAGQTYGLDYVNLLSLSTRQAMAAIEYTLPAVSSSGQLNTSDIKAFMKDMGYVSTADPPSDDSTPSSVNPVDVMYAAMPAYLYLNPNILGYLLRPLLEFQDSPQYTNNFAAQNLGNSFPNATGNTKAHNQGIEQSANMLIMTLAHAQMSGDGSLLSRHYPLLKQWGNYLVGSTLNPQQQTASLSDYISNTLATVTNQTNLALKGVIGIGAMAKIAEAMNQTEDAQMFSDNASLYASQWQSLTIVTGQPTLAFGSSGPGFLYNLFADSLLGLNLFDNAVYNDFTALLNVETPKSPFGIPLQNTSTTARADWMLFAAAIATDSNVRASMIGRVTRYNSQSLEGANLPFPVVYSATSGEQGPVGQGSPAVGAMYAPLALTISKKRISSNNTAGLDGGNGDGSGTSGSSRNGGGSGAAHLSGGAIAGIVIGSVVLVGGLAALLLTLYRKHTPRKARSPVIFDMDELPHVSSTHALVQPYLYDTVPPTSQAVGDYLNRSQNSNSHLPNPYSVAGDSIEPPSTEPPSSVNGSGASQGGRSGGTQSGELLSEMSRLREEVARMRSAVEQGNAPPPVYAENLDVPWPEEAADATIAPEPVPGPLSFPVDSEVTTTSKHSLEPSVVYPPLV